MERDTGDDCEHASRDQARTSHERKGREKTRTRGLQVRIAEGTQKGHDGHSTSRRRGTDTTKHGNGYIPDEVELDDGLPRGPLLVEVLGRERELEVCGL